ncbi:MAG: trigger factor [Bryobacterales bacterium]|nr:trigger factor [Bryobacterales bacterium]MBV9398259.1 trigger factor [Bryobacterales bacterium]
MALIEGCKHSLDITVPVAEVEQETERAAADLQKKVRLPGFRPGKAPLSLVKTRFASDIYQKVIEKLVPKFLNSAAEKENLHPVSRPEISDVHFHSGEPLRFRAEFEIAPTFDLGEYRGITITYSEPEVTEADLDTRLNQLREQKAEFVNEEPRPLQDGDYAMISLESLSGVAEKISQEELSIKIGGDTTVAAFSDNLRGASPDETREFEVTYPEEYERKNLAGRTVKFRATVKAVRRRELPELNDEFAKDLGDFKTLEELKETIRKNLLREREHLAQEEAKHELIEQLVQAHDFPVPESYVDRQIEMNVENQIRMLVAQGMDPKGLTLDWQKVREGGKERAVKDVKASLLLDKIAEREAIMPTQEDVDREVQKIARQQKEAVAMTRARLQKEGVIPRIASNIRTEKTLNFLFEQARKEAKRPEPEPEPGSSPE